MCNLQFKMAALSQRSKLLFPSVFWKLSSCLTQRTISSTQVYQNEREGWLSKLLHVRTIDPGKISHSRSLADAEIVYELHIHNVKPDGVDQYVKSYETYSKAFPAKVETSQLVGSWQVLIGDQDQFIHLWRHNQGYPSASLSLRTVHYDPDIVALVRDQGKLLRKRQNQYMLPFAFWGHPEPKENGGIYEMRSYILKPGTMIEWGNNWARGITYRRENAVAGFFSQIGKLHMVHHFWTYKNLKDRKETRERNWSKPGWDECVAYTVPLIREMRSRWIYSLPFSPLK